MELTREAWLEIAHLVNAVLLYHPDKKHEAERRCNELNQAFGSELWVVEVRQNGDTFCGCGRGYFERLMGVGERNG